MAALGHPTKGQACAQRRASTSSMLTTLCIASRRLHQRPAGARQQLPAPQLLATTSLRSNVQRCAALPDWLNPKKKVDSRPVRELERSALVNEEIIYLIFQLDLDTQLQRCLNYEAYEAAQDVRKKREKVDEAIGVMKERKAAQAGSPAGNAQLSVDDFTNEGLRLRTEMQRAVEEERYSDAAKFRDLLKELEVKSKQMQALAAEWVAPQPQLRLGQRVMHARHGYRGVVVGWDVQCCEAEEWVGEAVPEGALKRGTRQPFYHLLVDARDWEYDPHQPPVAYVAEELLTCPELQAAAAAAASAASAATSSGGSTSSSSSSSSSAPAALDPKALGSSWKEVHGGDPLQHPYTYILFLGVDARGDYLPCRQLRDKYNAKRRDVYPPGQDGTEQLKI